MIISTIINDKFITIVLLYYSKMYRKIIFFKQIKTIHSILMKITYFIQIDNYLLYYNGHHG